MLWTDGSTLVGDEVVSPGGTTFVLGDRVQLGGGESRGEDLVQRDAPPEVERCMEATDSTRVWVGGAPFRIDGGLL